MRNLFEVTCLQVLHLLTVIGWQCADLSMGFKHYLIRVYLGRNVTLRDQFGGLLDDWALIELELVLHCLNAE